MESSRWIRGVTPALLVVIAILAAPAPAAPTGDELMLASRADGASGAKGDENSLTPSLSADGSRLAFESNASNLHPADGDFVGDVFVRDLASHTNVLVSRAAGTSGAKGNGHSGWPSLSSDGRYVAFHSGATNLHPDDADGGSDIYVRDLATGSTVLVSRADGAAGSNGNGRSFTPSISADGSRVAFASTATNLDPADTDTVEDIYVRDLVTGTTTLVSRASETGAKGNRYSLSPDISGDGEVVAFESIATNLIPGDDGGFAPDVYARDLTTEDTLLVSRADGPAGAKVPGGRPSISDDGRYVAFDSFSAFVHPDDRDGSQDVFRRDLQAGTTILVSRATGGAGADGDSHSTEPDLSPDGRFVAFSSVADNIGSGSDDDVFHAYVRDTELATTTFASRGNGPLAANANESSWAPAVSADGTLVAFWSAATNLHPDDPDRLADVYLRNVQADRECELARVTARVAGGQPTRACL